MGDVDLVKVVLGKLADMRWMQIAIRPAKPFAFGLVDRGDRAVPVFGLPGNPVSSLVSFELLARPALRQMAGHDELDRPHVRAVADEPLHRRPDGKTHFARVAVPLSRWWRTTLASAGGQGSHQLAAMAAADGLAILPDGEGVDEGQTVDRVVARLTTCYRLAFSASGKITSSSADAASTLFAFVVGERCEGVGRVEREVEDA